MRNIWPSMIGLSPSGELRIALSTAGARARSQTETVIMRDSGTETVASWVSGVGEP